MTRRFTDGAESGDYTRMDYANLQGVTTNPTRLGAYAYLGRDQQTIYKNFMPALNEFYVRFAYYFPDSAFNDSYPCFGWYQASGARGGGIWPQSPGVAGVVRASVASTMVATSALVNLGYPAWHVFEAHVKLAQAGIIQIKLDGILVIDYSGDTRGNGITAADRLLWTFPTWATNHALDDIAVNDATGVVDNSWCGDGGVKPALVPNAAGTYTDLVASAGNAWDCVNEVPPNGDTDYVASATLDAKSTYGLTDLATLGAGEVIQRVWVEVVARETVAVGDKVATLLRSGSTDAQGSDQALTLSYGRFVSAEYLTDPADNAAWTKAKVDALEAGAVVR